MLNHLNPGGEQLPPQLLPYADANRSGGDPDEADLDWIVRSVIGEVGLYGTESMVRFATPSTAVLEGTSDAAVRIDLSGYDVDGSVSYDVTGGTATEGVDYAPIGGTAAVQINEVLIPLDIFEDAEREGFETIEISITGLTNLNGWSTELPTRITVQIEDNERLWTGAFRSGAPPYEDIVAFQMVTVREGANLSGRLLGESTASVPDGDWPMAITTGPGSFVATADDIPVPVGMDFFGSEVTRAITLIADPNTVSSADDGTLTGHFVDALQSAEAPHLNTDREGTFSLNRVADGTPEPQPELQTN